MNRFQPHMPNFMDLDRVPDAEFSTVDELLALPQPKRFASEPGFMRFSQSQSPHGTETLMMAEYADGKFYVVGYLREPVDGLPDWPPDVR